MGSQDAVPLMNRADSRVLIEIAALFLRLGATAFGGPAVHVAMMEDEVVRRRAWLTREAFLDMLGATNLIPGPNSTELALLIGQRRAGFVGLCVAGVAFVTPALLVVLALSWAYVHHGQLTVVAAVLHGVKPVVLAIVLQALVGLSRSALAQRGAPLACVGALMLSLSGLHELAVLAACGAALALGRNFPSRPRLLGCAWVTVLAPPATALALVAPFQLSTLFLAFLKIGATLFGSGYVLLAFLRAEFVVRLGWLSEAQLLDAVAIGQVTPGPLSTTATFVGYLMGGPMGAFTATLGIFLPAFVLVTASAPLIPRLRRSSTAGAFLDGVNAASLALMALVTVALGHDALRDWPDVLLACVSALLLLRYRVNSMGLIAAGALMGGVRVWSR